jgi:hypothetical protein
LLTKIWYSILLDVTGFSGANTVTRKSALTVPGAGLTNVVSVSVLLDETGSGSLPRTLTVLLTVPGVVGLAVIKMEVPPTKIPMLQVTTPEEKLQLPLFVEAETKFKPDDNLLVTTTPVAGEGPSLSTKIE